MAPHNETVTVDTNGPSNISVPGGRHDSKVSVNTNTSVRSHQEYLDSLIPPTEEEIKRISSVQEAKEEEIIRKRLSTDNPELSSEERMKAAELIQKNYRGHRERRQMQGLGLDPSSRWTEALREAKYRNWTTPKARVSLEGVGTGTDTDGTRNYSDVDELKRSAREKWRKVGFIARRAAGDEDSDVESDEDEDLPDEQREEKRRKRLEQTQKRQKEAKMMDLQYFLEMVDLKHRYGSNLRTYHQEWKKSATRENFFYWLDEGDGRFIDVAGCPRERLDSEKVRYLSKEERLSYLVKINKEGRLVWAKNGARIDTTEEHKDSIHGIVPTTDPTPSYTGLDSEAATGLQSHESDVAETSDSSAEDHHNISEDSAANKYATPEIGRSKGMRKIRHVSAATIFSKLLRSSVKKNTWIFVADTSFRLYVGIKQSGAFQHSSFLHGSRIAAAGLIKIRDGLLDKLSPLSGHYRPNTSHFRAFVQSLKEAGADMSHLSISRSYAVLIGLEMYVKTKRRGKKVVRALLHGRDMVLTHDEQKKREEEGLDRTEAAEREKRFQETQEDEDARDENKANVKLIRKLHIRPTTPKHGVDGAGKGTIEEKPREEERVNLGNASENAKSNRGDKADVMC